MHRSSRSVPFLVTATLAAALTPTIRAQDSQPVLVTADRIHIAPDTVLDGPAARLVIRDGRIVAVGQEIPASLLDSAERRELSGTLVPGFVNPHDLLEVGADLGERIEAWTPSLMAADAFDPLDKALRRLTEGGVTSIALAPASTNTAGGLATVVKWTGKAGKIVAEQSYLKLSLAAESLDRNRYPTSRMGAADLARSEFQRASSPLATADDDTQVLRDALGGGRNLVFHARSNAELCEALRLCEDFSLRPIICGAETADKHIDQLRAVAASLILEPLDFNSKPARLKLPAALHQAGLRFSFAAKTPDRLRRTAALAVRHGLPRSVALAALTRIPAEQCGIAEQVGSLRIGRAADFAVFDGSPLDLSSRLIAVYVDGQPIVTTDPSANPRKPAR